jgi:hypothetical protein
LLSSLGHRIIDMPEDAVSASTTDNMPQGVDQSDQIKRRKKKPRTFAAEYKEWETVQKKGPSTAVSVFRRNIKLARLKEKAYSSTHRDMSTSPLSMTRR